MSKILVIDDGGFSLAGMLAAMPDLVVSRENVTRQDLIDAGYFGQELGSIDTVRYIENVDCQPPEFDFDESQSWQQMNKGHYSKKQRRGKL